MGNDLVQGGQGRTPSEVIDSSMNFGLCLGVAISILLVAFVAALPFIL